MPITNEVAITPSAGGGGGGAIVPEGVYQVEVSDISYIPGEQNQFSGKPQLRFKFKILEGEHEGVELGTWTSLSMNPGWDKGNPSNLYLIAKGVAGEDPNLDKEFYPNSLMGGKLRILVEERTSKNGNKFAKVTKYLSLEMTQSVGLNNVPSVKPSIVSQNQEEEIPF